MVSVFGVIVPDGSVSKNPSSIKSPVRLAEESSSPVNAAALVPAALRDCKICADPRLEYPTFE